MGRPVITRAVQRTRQRIADAASDGKVTRDERRSIAVATAHELILAGAVKLAAKVRKRVAKRKASKPRRKVKAGGTD